MLLVFFTDITLYARRPEIDAMLHSSNSSFYTNKSCGAKFLIIARAATTSGLVKKLKNAKTSSIPHLTKEDQSFMHSVERANNLAEMFSEHSTLSESDQPLPCLKSTEEQGQLKECSQISILTSKEAIVGRARL